MGPLYQGVVLTIPEKIDLVLSHHDVDSSSHGSTGICDGVRASEGASLNNTPCTGYEYTTEES